MNKLVITVFTILTAFISSCSNEQTGSTNQSEKTGGLLKPTAFESKTKELSSATIIDVRTPEEFSKGHLPNAQNIDWKGDKFMSQIDEIDKTEPVFVYCLSGGRSSQAAQKMKEEGFSEVYELEGGIMKWRANNLPETTSNEFSTTGMTMAQFEDLLNTDKTVLVDFYATWCGPCQMMKPYLKEIAEEMSATVTVVRIDIDENRKLSESMGIESLPTLQIYKNKTMVWNNLGYITKDKVVEQLK